MCIEVNRQCNTSNPGVVPGVPAQRKTKMRKTPDTTGLQTGINKKVTLAKNQTIMHTADNWKLWQGCFFTD